MSGSESISLSLSKYYPGGPLSIIANVKLSPNYWYKIEITDENGRPLDSTNVIGYTVHSHVFIIRDYKLPSRKIKGLLYRKKELFDPNPILVASSSLVLPDSIPLTRNESSKISHVEAVSVKHDENTDPLPSAKNIVEQGYHDFSSFSEPLSMDAGESGTVSEDTYSPSGNTQSEPTKKFISAVILIVLLIIIMRRWL